MTEQTSRGEYRRLWHGWYKQKIRAILVVLGLMGVVAIASAMYSKGIQVIVAAMEIQDPTVMYWGPLIVIALTVVKAAAQYLSVNLSNALVGRVSAELRTKMFADLVDADLERLVEVAPAEQANKFSTDINLVDRATRNAIKGLTSVLTIVVSFIVMLTIDWPLTLGLIGVFVLALLPVNLIGRKVRVISRNTQAEIGRMMSSITENLNGIRLARTYQLEAPLKAQAGTQFQKLYALMLKMVRWEARVAPVMEILAGAAVAVLLGVVGWRMTQDSISLADFMALLTGLGVASNPARRLGATYASLQQGRAALERIYALFDAKNHVADAPNAIAMPIATGGIKFENVDFSYPDGTAALSGFDLNIPAGTKVAFVGRSGAGKSTIFNLLPRLYDPVGGRILLDGMDLKEIKLADLRRQIAVVSQESVLLSTSVVENIGYGRPDHTRDDVIAAAKAAAAHDFISLLPNGYDTLVGPGQGTFSGGEKQRLSIARAILRQSPVLLLDEPTSALDAESESLIRSALDALSHGRTTLIIAHRLATILDADMIVVMDKGRIVETGKHADLLANGGLYADLYKLQFDS